MSEKFTYDPDIDEQRQDKMDAIHAAARKVEAAPGHDKATARLGEIATLTLLSRPVRREMTALEASLPPASERPKAVSWDPVKGSTDRPYGEFADIKMQKAERELASHAAANIDQLYDHAAIEANKDLRRRAEPSRIITYADERAAEAERIRDHVAPGGEVPVGTDYNTLADNSETYNLGHTTYTDSTSNNLVLAAEGFNRNPLDSDEVTRIIPAEQASQDAPNQLVA